MNLDDMISEKNSRMARQICEMPIAPTPCFLP